MIINFYMAKSISNILLIFIVYVFINKENVQFKMFNERSVKVAI